MRVRTGIGQDEEDDEFSRLEKMRAQNYDIRNQISSDITPQDIPDIRRLGALSAIQGIPGVSNAESAAIEASPKAQPEASSQQEFQAGDFFSPSTAIPKLGRALYDYLSQVPEAAGKIQQGVTSGVQSTLESLSPKTILEETSKERELYNPYSAISSAGSNLASIMSPENILEISKKAQPIESSEFFINPPQYLEKQQAIAQEQLQKEEKIKSFNQRAQEAIANGNPDIIDGEIEALGEDPIAQAQIEKITGLSYDDLIEDGIKDYVSAADSATEALNDEARAIRERIMQGSAALTFQDKVMLGLAVLIPVVLAGAIGGKEGALGALSGSLNAIGSVMNESNGIDHEKARKRLSDIEKEKLDIEKKVVERAEDVEKKITKKGQIPNTNIHVPAELSDRESITFVDPKTKETKAGVRTINDDLWYDANNLNPNNAKADLDRMQESVKDAIIKTKAAKDIDSKIKQMDSILDQLVEQGTIGYGIALSEAIARGGGNLLSAQVIDPLTGKKVNAVATYNSIRENVIDKYRTALGGKQALTEDLRHHFGIVLPNPFDPNNKLTVEEAKSVQDTFRGNSLLEMVNNLEIQGFLREPLESKYLRPIQNESIENRKSHKQKKQIEQSNKAIRENKEALKRGAEVELG